MPKHVTVAELAAGAVQAASTEEVYVKAMPMDAGQQAEVAATDPTVAVDLQHLFNQAYERFTSVFVNTSGGDRTLVIGGFKLEHEAALNLGIAAVANGNPGIADKSGASTPALNWLNDYIWSNSVIVKEMTINTANDATGLAQRSNQVNPFTVSTNLDDCNVTGALPFFDTEFSGIRSKLVFGLGSRYGIQYLLDDTETINIELNYLGIAIPSFSSK